MRRSPKLGVLVGDVEPTVSLNRAVGSGAFRSPCAALVNL